MSSGSFVGNVSRAASEAFVSTKDAFERHRVVFTIAASLASAGAAWAGYTARQIHQHKLEERLRSIEHAMTSVHNIGEEQARAITKQTAAGTVNYRTCGAATGLALLIGYGFGWKSGSWYTVRRLSRRYSKRLEKEKPKQLC